MAHERLRFGERICMSHHFHIGRGIKASHKVARQTAMVAIDNDHRHITHHFFIIDKCVDDGINQGDYQKEDDESSVGKYVAQGVAKGFMHIIIVREP